MSSGRPSQALVVRREWAVPIMEGKKCWELRGTNLRKRGVFAVAASRTGLLAGEVTFVDSFPVGRRHRGRWIPYSDSAEDQDRFFLQPHNVTKHQVFDVSVVTYKVVYAWVLCTPREYDPPVRCAPVPGPLRVNLLNNAQWPERLRQSSSLKRGLEDAAASSSRGKRTCCESECEEQQKQLVLRKL
jgi:hypothetical protein